MNYFFATERLLLTLWVGGMWITGYMVAPVLFGVLDDRQLAGMLAGHMFTAMSYIGLACGVLLLVGWVFRNGVKYWRNAAVLLMLSIVIIGQFVLQPMMADLKTAGIAEGTANAAQFGKLHGIASILFLINSLTGLVLVVLPANEN
jgi:hypothetical protein